MTEKLSSKAERAVRHPNCNMYSGLAVRGRWGDPAVIVCPHGHEWEPADRAWATELLQRALLATG